MKKYLLFAWHEFTATGGWNDFVADYDNIEDAKRFIGHDSKLFRENAIIVDRDNKSIILTGKHKYNTCYNDIFYHEEEDWGWDDDSKNEEFIETLIWDSCNSHYEKLIEKCKNNLSEVLEVKNINIQGIINGIINLVGIYNLNYKEMLNKYIEIKDETIEQAYSKVIYSVLFDLDEIYKLDGQLKNYPDLEKDVYELLMGA